MIVAYLAEKRKRLETQDKRLSPYFVEVYIESLKASIPFLSIRAFREADVFDGNQIEKTFLSSGSTQSKRARHHFSLNGLTKYAQGALEGWFQYAHQASFPTATTIFSLVPTIAEWPQSSLAAMIDMFAHNGLTVTYVNENSLARETLSRLSTNQHIVLFGTSFHFVQLAQTLGRNPIDADDKDVFIVDTGGTKGRTESYAPSELRALIRTYFSQGTRLHFHSEYGMCELSSQAYGTKPGHFFCSPQLNVYAVDASDINLVRETKNTGFLAFIDNNNCDSYPAILTEDLGVSVASREFILQGRAPDAAIKGCSLRVNPQFTFANNKVIRQSVTPNVIFEPKHQKPDASSLLNSLDKNEWDKFAIHDLQKSLMGWEQPTHFSNLNLKGCAVGIVASANIPITWLFPTRFLSDAGVAEVHLFLPSLRPDDALSARVRKQIESLARAVSSQLKCRVILYREKISEDDLKSFKKLLVFGQNETVQLYRVKFTNVIGFGDVLNQRVVSQNETTEEIAEQCAAWFGRGCLTPTAILAANFSANEFVETLSELFLKRAQATHLPEIGTWIQSAHVFDTIDLGAELKQAGLSPNQHIFRKAPVTVVDLRGKSIPPSDINWSYGGSGLVYLVDEVDSNFSNFLSEPTLQSPHCGKHWDEWLQI